MAIKKQVKKPTTKTRNTKYIVKPGMSLRGVDLRQRIQNRTVSPNMKGVYSLDPLVDQSRRMSKIDAAREMVTNKTKIQGLKQKAMQEALNQETAKRDTEKEAIAKAAIEKYKQQQNNNNNEPKQ